MFVFFQHSSNKKGGNTREEAKKKMFGAYIYLPTDQEAVGDFEQ